jgi:hypothetical protein
MIDEEYKAPADYRKQVTFTQARKILPICLCPDYVGRDKTLADLRFLAETELDLHHAGDIELTDSDIRELCAFLRATA